MRQQPDALRRHASAGLADGPRRHALHRADGGVRVYCAAFRRASGENEPTGRGSRQVQPEEGENTKVQLSQRIYSIFFHFEIVKKHYTFGIHYT